MAFRGTSAVEIAREIAQREAEIGRLSWLEFDKAEYQILCATAFNVVRYRTAGRSSQTIVLTVAFEIMRREQIYAEQGFWDEFESRLGLYIGENRSFIYDLLEDAFSYHGIHLQRDYKRWFVSSLKDELALAHAARREVRGFFVWYFRSHFGSPVTSEVLTRFRRQSGHTLPITSQALEALSEDCHKLAHVIECAIENEITLSESAAGWADYCRAVVSLLGLEYDPSGLRIVRDADALRRVVLELQNHRTPAQFLRELERFSNASVQVPGSGSLSVAALRARRADELNYGLYRVQPSTVGRTFVPRAPTEYRVVPCTWLPLETLQGWPNATLMTPRAGWLGYRKGASFLVCVGEREVTSRRCVFPNGQSCYLWVGEAVPGQKLVVDGHTASGAEGVSWEAALRLTHDENRAPCLSLVLLKLLAYLPQSGGDEVEARLFQADMQVGRETRRLDPDGALALYRDVRFPLREFSAPLSMQVRAGHNDTQRSFAPASAWLFSVWTREAVAPNRSHQQDGRRFVLFCLPDEQPQAGQGVALARIESGTAPYDAWQVEWVNDEFSLRVGDLSWHIERQRYFEAWLEPHEPLALSEGATGLMLAPQQRHGFDESTIRVATNWAYDDATLRCRLARGTEAVFECSLSEALQARGGDALTLSSSFARRLNEAVAGRYGRYTLRFYEDATEDEAERVLAQVPVSVVPRVSVQLSQRLVTEGESVPLHIASSRGPLWNPQIQANEEAVTLNLFPTVEALPPRSKMDAPDDGEDDAAILPRWKPQIVSGLVSLPSLSESLRVAALPTLFGFRLLRRLQNGERWEVAEVDWFALDECSLHLFSKARAMVECVIDGHIVWQGQADEDGQAVLDDLKRLRPFCRGERTLVAVASTVAGETAQSRFQVRWAPRVFALALDGEAVTVRGSGPSNTGIVLRFEGNGGYVEELLPCTESEALSRCNIPHLPDGERPRSVVAFGWQGDGELVPSSHRLLLPMSVAASTAPSAAHCPPLPDDWWHLGVGFSSVQEMEQRVAR